MERLHIASPLYVVKFAPDGTEAYRSIKATIDGITMSVPLDPANRHYAEIMRQVNEGTLVIQPAEENS